MLPEHTQQEDVIYHDEHVTAFIGLYWWPNNPGHVIIVPNRHIENIYDLTPDIAIHVYELARQVAIAFKKSTARKAHPPASTTNPPGIRKFGISICTSFPVTIKITCTTSLFSGG